MFPYSTYVCQFCVTNIPHKYIDKHAVSLALFDFKCAKN